MTDSADNEIWTGADLRAVAAELHGSPQGAIPALAERFGAGSPPGRTVGFRHDAHTRFRRRADPKYQRVSAPLETGWRRDEWLVADGPAQAGGGRRVYVIHTWPPRFRCRVVAVEPGTGLPEPDHANAGNRRSTLPDPHEPAGVPSRRRNLDRMMRSEGDAEEVPNARTSIGWETNPRNRIPVENQGVPEEY